MENNTPSDFTARDEESHALPRFPQVSPFLTRERSRENGGGIQNAGNSSSEEQNQQDPENRHNEIYSHPRRRSSLLGAAIQARPDLLKHEPPRDNLVFGVYLPPNDDPNILSRNPNNRNPELMVQTPFGRNRDNRWNREYSSNPHSDENGRHTPERPEKETEAFTPTVRRRKAQYQEEQQRIARQGALRSEEQMSGDCDVAVAESSAQGAQRALASRSRISESISNLPRVNNVNEECITAVTREGMNVEEKSSNNNPSSGEPSSRPPSVSSGEREQNEPGPPLGSNSQPIARPLATPHQHRQSISSRITGGDTGSEIILPRWQPDSEVENCPICHRPFGFFSRKHHCRKCGRVVCNACSPHRITIPHQYIVQPPIGPDDFVPEHARTRSRTVSQNSVHDSSVGGGMKVRLCNPCVPDPNTSPPALRLSLERPLPSTPQSNSLQPQPPSRTTSTRERVRRSELCPVCSDRLPPSTTAVENHIDRCIARHFREAEINASPQRHRVPIHSGQVTDSSSLPSTSNTFSHPTRPRHTSEATTPGSSALSGSNFPVTARNPSVNATTPELAPSRPFLSSRMICFTATHLDSVGEDSECIICMEDFEEGVEMARLECLCKYHKHCIDGWFFKHPGRCPVHGQDNY